MDERSPHLDLVDFLPALQSACLRPAQLTRRGWLALSASAAGGLLMACGGPGSGSRRGAELQTAGDASDAATLGLFVAIEPDGRAVIGARARLCTRQPAQVHPSPVKRGVVKYAG